MCVSICRTIWCFPRRPVNSPFQTPAMAGLAAFPPRVARGRRSGQQATGGQNGRCPHLSGCWHRRASDSIGSRPGAAARQDGPPFQPMRPGPHLAASRLMPWLTKPRAYIQIAFAIREAGGGRPSSSDHRSPNPLADTSFVASTPFTGRLRRCVLNLRKNRLIRHARAVRAPGPPRQSSRHSPVHINRHERGPMKHPKVVSTSHDINLANRAHKTG